MIHLYEDSLCGKVAVDNGRVAAVQVAQRRQYLRRPSSPRLQRLKVIQVISKEKEEEEVMVGEQEQEGKEEDREG